MRNPHKMVFLAALCRECAKYEASPYYKKEPTSLAELMATEEENFRKGEEDEDDVQREAFVSLKITELREFLYNETGEAPNMLMLLLSGGTSGNPMREMFMQFAKILPEKDCDEIAEKIAKDIFRDGVIHSFKKRFGIDLSKEAKDD